VKALNKELELRNSFLEEQTIETIYFGGGTPSTLALEDLHSIFQQMYRKFEISNQVEVTFEVNPDDLSEDYLKGLKQLGVNRLSMGVQSFFDEDLQVMNRRHNARQAEECVQLAKDCGFKNISIDLIYGLPQMNIEKWQANLDKAFSLDIQHISAYHLTYEKGTVFDKLRNKGKLTEIDEDESLVQFELLIRETAKNNFVQYEISNFGKEGYFSKHNSNYWFQVQYLGIGPSAHSFNQLSRCWNVADLAEYIKGIESGEMKINRENLSRIDKYNDYVMTRMRTIWGLSYGYMEDLFGEDMRLYCEENAKKYLISQDLFIQNNHLCLTQKGKFISDAIISDLFYVED